MSRQNESEKSDSAARQRGDLLLTGFRSSVSVRIQRLRSGNGKGDVIIEYNGLGDLTTEKLTDLTATTRAAGRETRVVFLREGHEHSLKLPPGLSAFQLWIAQFKVLLNSKWPKIKLRE